MRTGGGSPKKLQLTTVENELIDFLTPDAAGLSNISEGGFGDSNFMDSSIVQNEKQYYSTLLSTEEKSNVDKISLSDSSEDLSKEFLSHNVSLNKRILLSPFISNKSSAGKKSNTDEMSLNDSEDIMSRMVQTKKIQSSIMGKKQFQKVSETLVSLNIQEKENIHCMCV